MELVIFDAIRKETPEGPDTFDVYGDFVDII